MGIVPVSFNSSNIHQAFCVQKEKQIKVEDKL